MGLVIANIVKDRSPGASATTINDIEIKKSYPILALNLQFPSRNNGAVQTTLANLIALAGQQRVNTIFGAQQSVIEAQDLYDFDILALREFPQVHTSALDNDPIYAGMTMPFSPFAFDYDRQYGLPANAGTTYEMDWAADANNIDGRTVTVTAFGNPDAKPLGWTSFYRDARSATTAGDELKTKIQGGKRLLGVHMFGTTCIADLGAADAFNITTFRELKIYESSDVKLGPVNLHYPLQQGAYEIGAVIDEGSSYWDFGFQTTADPVGIDVSVGSWEFGAVRGATDAGRQYPVILR